MLKSTATSSERGTPDTPGCRPSRTRDDHGVFEGEGVAGGDASSIASGSKGEGLGAEGPGADDPPGAAGWPAPVLAPGAGPAAPPGVMSVRFSAAVAGIAP